MWHSMPFFADRQVICEASICWLCSNIYSRAGEDAMYFDLKGDSAESRELLKVCEKALDERAPED